MNDIVFQGSEGQPLTNSVLVAEKFDRRHDNVYQAIGKLLITCPEKLGHLFVESSYIDIQGKDRPMYIMNRDGFTLLAMGFTGKKALQFKLDYIEAFNKMEKAIKEVPALSSPIDATILKQLVEATQVMAAQISQMQVELNRQRALLPEPKQILPVQPSVRFEAKERRISPRQIPYFTVKKMATELGTTSKQLNAVLEVEDIQRWNFPKQRWELNPVYRGCDLTYTVVYEPVDPDDEPREYMVWSSNGRKFIYDVLSERRRLQQQY